MMGISTQTTVVDEQEFRTFSHEEVAEHHTAKSLWLTLGSKVYDVTNFMFDHPGGEELLLQYGGKDVSEVMRDPIEHEHSESAYELLEEYYIGELAASSVTASALKSEGASVLKKRTTTTTTTTATIPVEPFIDVTKPMLVQVWFGNFSKEHYLKHVHMPRHAHGSAPIFGNPILESLTKTVWYAVPMFWAPIWIVSLYLASQKIGLPATLQWLPLGVLLWTVIEYTLHRFLFHVEMILPDNRVALTLHFLLHGIHHFLPMDRLRLVMPPALSVILGIGLWNFFSAFLPKEWVYGLATGVIPGYVAYDLIHFYLHHGRPFAAHLRTMKSYHLDHHYKDANLGYGITTKLWDRVFGTLL